MIALVFFVLLLARQASSSPVPIEQSKADAKVMNCVVEVISDTLSKPSPLPISQECMETLKGDERIISMLRHQNLLRELQELAAEGANEMALQKKENNDYKEKQLSALKNDDDKKIDYSQEVPAREQQRSSTEKVVIKDDEEETIKERQPAVRRHSFMNTKDTTTDANSIATDRDRRTARKLPIGNKSMKSESSENESAVDQSHEWRQSEKHSTEAHDEEDTEEVGEDQIKESDEEDEEENHNHYEDSKDEELTYSEEPSKEVWGDEATNSDSSEVGENGKVSDEEIRSNEDDKSHQNSEKVEEEYSSKNDEKDELSEEWEENKQKMDEFAPEQKLRKHEEMSDEDKSIRFENPKPHSRRGHFQHLQGNRRSHSEEDRQKEKMFIASSTLRKRLDVEDKKEEEGSATRKSEEQEVESLEEIESELEAMARRLHQMRSR
ncbi:chromogranin-A isoform X2 [Pristis pectinata]|uniref:chromogranin-A isoform X2 n=1 Tax=Pristis pectinata TaxID=685728 RepID=UPI00223DC9A3|nr:chromogranin-A isoform X2 [Pristis pectinata]